MNLSRFNFTALLATLALLLAACGQQTTPQTEAQPNPPTSKVLAATPGTVVAWGDPNNASLPAGLSSAIAISAGQGYSLALKPDGTVVAWNCGGPASNFGQCTVPSGLMGVTAIAAGWVHSLALKSDSSVVAWGCSGIRNYGQCNVPSGLTGVTAIVAGSRHSLALKNDGTVVVWGCNGSVNSVDFGQCNVPSGLTGVTAIAASWYHSLALKSDGTVVAWGCGIQNVGQCTVASGLTGVTAIAAGINHSLALKSDGTVVAWGCRSGFAAGQCTVPTGLTGVMAISAADLHSMALKNDGTVVAWGCAGSYNYGQCNVPSGLTGVMAISAGQDHSLALVGVSTDTTAPTANPTQSPTANAAGWNNTDVTVNWNWTDNSGGTGIDPTNCTTPSTATDEGSITLTATCKDLAGNEGSASYTVKVDKTAPTIVFGSRTAANGAGWNNSEVSIDWTCSDATSGVVSPTVRQTVSSEGSNQSSTGTCEDNAGNRVSDTQSGINIDKTAPTLNPVVSPNPVLLNASATVSSGANDRLSGLASESCGSVDTSSAGSKSVTCSAADNAGNSASASASYQVIYTFRGFFSPVDNLPTLNGVKAGQAIPVKFSLNGNQGLNILASGSPSSQAIACASGTAIDDIEETVTAGNSSLSYDAATDTYSYVWKTQKSWAGTCRQLIVTLVDGTQHVANFKFK